MSDVTLTRAEVLGIIQEELDRAYQDAECRLTEDVYDTHDGLFTHVQVRVHSGDGQKISKFHKVADAANFRRWTA